MVWASPKEERTEELTNGRPNPKDYPQGSQPESNQREGAQAKSYLFSSLSRFELQMGLAWSGLVVIGDRPQALKQQHCAETRAKTNTSHLASWCRLAAGPALGTLDSRAGQTPTVLDCLAESLATSLIKTRVKTSGHLFLSRLEPLWLPTTTRPHCGQGEAHLYCVAQYSPAKAIEMQMQCGRASPSRRMIFRPHQPA